MIRNLKSKMIQFRHAHHVNVGYLSSLKQVVLSQIQWKDIACIHCIATGVHLFHMAMALVCNTVTQ